MKKYINFEDLKTNEINFALGTDRQGKALISMYMNEQGAEVSVLSPACVTNWPRVTGDGNFGTMWGPTDIQKAKFTLDLTDAYINNNENVKFNSFADKLTEIDDRLLDFVQANQLKILGRKNLSREEVKMLQIRTIRPKYDKITGILAGHSVQMSASKFTWDGCGGKMSRVINICDHNGNVVPNGNVQPGDVVAATMFANQVYTGVGGDKFGIHWSFEDVQIVCQRSRLAQKTFESSFLQNTYDFAMPYTMEIVAPTENMQTAITEQFSEPMAVN